ncbi:MAG: DUF5667 domain-containing protein [Anaerolineales bacterium]
MMCGIEELLAQCLKEIEEGDSMEECLARRPERREELEPLLRMVQRMRAAPRVTPSLEFRQSARTRMLNMIESGESTARSRQSDAPRQGGFFPRLGLAVPTMVTIILIALLATTGLGVVRASSRSLPGEPLYGVRLATERIRLALAPTPAGLARAHLASAERRLEDATRLAEANGEKYMETLMSQYMEQVQAANGVLQKQRLRDNRIVPLAEHLEERLTYHQEVLEQVRAHTPPEAQVGIKRAMEASQRAREQAGVFLDKPEGPPAEKMPPRQGPPSHAPVAPGDDPADTEKPTRTGPTARPSPQSEDNNGRTPPGQIQRPQQSGQTTTPQPLGQTATPRRRVQTGAPPGPASPTMKHEEEASPVEQASPTREAEATGKMEPTTQSVPREMPQGSEQKAPITATVPTGELPPFQGPGPPGPVDGRGSEP